MCGVSYQMVKPHPWPPMAVEMVFICSCWNFSRSHDLLALRRALLCRADWDMSDFHCSAEQWYWRVRESGMRRARRDCAARGRPPPLAAIAIATIHALARVLSSVANGTAAPQYQLSTTGPADGRRKMHQ